MKTVAFSVLFSIFSLASFAQTDSTKANSIISAILSMDAKNIRLHIDKHSATNLAINDCVNILDYTPVETISDSQKAASDVIRLIKAEIGNTFTLTWADCISFEYYKDTPIAIVFILQNLNGERMKINIFVTPDYKIRDITIYQNSCNHF